MCVGGGEFIVPSFLRLWAQILPGVIQNILEHALLNHPTHIAGSGGWGHDLALPLIKN